MHTTGQPDGSWPIPEGLARAIRDTAEEIATLVRSAGDTGRAVPGSRWTVGEAAAHLAMANELMADLAAGRERPYGDGTPESLARANAESLAVFTERRAEPLATMITEQAEAFLDALSHHEADGPAPATPMGLMDRSVLASYLLTHMLGHGYDLARALQRPHMVDRTRVGLCMPFMLSAMPRVTNPAVTAGLTTRYRILLRGGAAFGVSLADGAVQVTPVTPGAPLRRPHCTILLDPVAFLLIALGRLNPWRAIARGQVLTWGSRPWLATRFPTLFTAP
ncbi:maleylpyruvate isomerase family mycothiol-dependent enzyme [Streptomyces sp. NPDC004232]|uniref:maleylpyruvate isomerase family mycothiol-dependent enzyme n=1 Tax=unclassified Streptomyces TaxID=2593676 RepID=UPI001DF1FEA8|nr:maleylpyruvate isomerase family mycothiol-dependent enzyme [Streptomyces sp. tea 10]